MCLCAHGCVILKFCLKGKCVGLALVPLGRAAPQVKGVAAPVTLVLQADWPLQHTPLWESCSPLPV